METLDALLVRPWNSSGLLFCGRLRNKPNIKPLNNRACDFAHVLTVSLRGTFKSITVLCNELTSYRSPANIGQLSEVGKTSEMLARDRQFLRVSANIANI